MLYHSSSSHDKDLATTNHAGWTCVLSGRYLEQGMPLLLLHAVHDGLSFVILPVQNVRRTQIGNGNCRDMQQSVRGFGLLNQWCIQLSGLSCLPICVTQ